MNGFLHDLCAVVHVMNSVAAGTSVQTATSVDMTLNNGYDAARFIADIGALTASQVTTMQINGSPDNSVWTLITGAITPAMLDAQSNKMLVVDIIRPNPISMRYLQAVINRATANAVINCVICELYRTRKAPITQDATLAQFVKVGPLI